MADRPVIFSAPMVKALLEGRKSQTRRVLKSQPPEWVTRMCHEGRNGWIGSGDGHGVLMHVPYAPGDRLWVREAHAFDSVLVRYYATDDVHELRKKRSPIHMPRWASRLTLTVTDVRVQRLQEISGEDCLAEGACEAAFLPLTDQDAEEAREAFRSLWTSLHGPDAWDANPWICALTFTVSRGNIDGGAA